MPSLLEICRQTTRRLYASVFCLLAAAPMITLSAAPADEVSDGGKGKYVVVIDPGHGGKDKGCVGKKAREKDIVLDVGKRLGQKINDEFDKVDVVFTRDNDRFLTLQERAAVANNAAGDVFISIHVNSVDRRNRRRAQIHGASVYTLGLHKSESNLSVAMRENSVMELEDDYSENYQGFDPNSSESYIIFELNQNRHMLQSIDLADIMQHELVSTAGRADKGVRQAGFWVLWATSMPSVLVELDFICNAEAENFLASEDGREKCAEALFNAFKEYYTGNGSNGVIHRDVKTAGNTSSDNKNVRADVKDKESKDVTVSRNKTTYHVQILASKKKLKKNDSQLRGVKDVGHVRDGNFYKYYSGSYKTESEARQALKKLKKRFRDAYVIKMRGDKII